MNAFIGLWAIVFALLVLNGFAAGMAAVLHVWRKGQSRRSRALTAAAISGLVPLGLSFPAVFVEASIGAAPLLELVVGFAAVSGLTMAISLPGAVIVARKLEAPGEAYKTFE